MAMARARARARARSSLGITGQARCVTGHSSNATG